MTTEGLLRKYKLSKLSENIVLNKYEQEIVDYLNEMFSNITCYKVSDVVPKLTAWYFNSDDMFIMGINKHTDDFLITFEIFDHIRTLLDNYTRAEEYTFIIFESGLQINDRKTIKILTEFVEYYLDKKYTFYQVIRDTKDIYKAFNDKNFIKC